ncbi:MAG: hypothetical protein AB1689_12330 [Thermodesulfobacteriota bacterium]
MVVRIPLAVKTTVLGAFMWALPAAAAAGAQTVTVSLPAARDTTIMEAHPRDNDGAWGFLWLKWNSARGFENRIAVGFDLSPLAGRAGDVHEAVLVLRAADHTFPLRGTGIGVFFMEPGTLADWVEGDRRFDRLSYCSRRDLFRAPTGEGGPGATWTCEDDAGAVDPSGAPVCTSPPPATSWRGGLPEPGEPQRGFRAVASDAQIEHKLYDPLCRKALACFAASASADCWRNVELDVTADVREALELGHHAPSWLVKKDRVEAGAARFFSREGAVCLLGIPELGPRLRVTLAQRPGDPPPIAEPDDHCAAATP